MEENNNYCTNCGTKLYDGDLYCSNCGVKKDLNINDKYDSPIVLCIISLLCMVCPIVFIRLNMLFPTILLPTIGLIIMIIVRVRYPNYKFGTIIMYMYIIYIVLAFLTIFAVQSFINDCNNNCYLVG